MNLSKWLTSEVKKELTHLWRLALPIVITNALLMLLQIEDQIVLGHLGDEELAAAALGTTIFNLIFFFICGAASACDTLIAQAYGGRDFQSAERWTRMGLFVLSIICIPSAVIFQYGEWVVLNVFKQDEHLARLAGKYTQLLLPGLFPLTWFIVLQKSLQARNILLPLVWLMLLSNILNIFGNWLFVFQLDLGYQGSPLATSVSRILTFLMTAVYCYGLRRKDEEELRQERAHRQSVLCICNRKAQRQRHTLAADSVTELPQLSAEPLMEEAVMERREGTALGFWQALWRFVALAIPGGIMVGLEAWSFDWTVVPASLTPRGVRALDAHQSMMSISAFTFLTIPLAIAIAASIRVGNLLGAQQPKQARLAAKLCIMIGVTVMAVFAIIIIAVRNVLGRIFSNDQEVITIVARIAPIMALYQVFDGFQGVCAGALRGAGRQSVIAVLNLCGFWVLGLPFGLLLCFVAHFGVYGIWWGFCLGLLVCSCLYAWLIQKIDWEVEAVRAKQAVLVTAEDKEGRDRRQNRDWTERLSVGEKGMTASE